jgi:glycosyltransferase involved in cell wall biosynthesis
VQTGPATNANSQSKSGKSKQMNYQPTMQRVYDHIQMADAGVETDSLRSGGPPVVWFEVEDFLRYFDHFSNPTGVQRVPFEIFVEAEKLYGGGGRVRFCRLSVYTKQLKPLGFDAVVSAYLKPPGAKAPWKTIWGPARFWSELSGMLPVIMRHPWFFFSILKTAIRDVIDLTIKRRQFERSVRPGDIIVSLGASWGFPHYAKHIAEAKRRHRTRFAVLVHDVIPIEHKCFVEPEYARTFAKWLHETIPHADVVLTVSKYTRNALVRLAAQSGSSLPRVEVLQMGGGLSDRPLAAVNRAKRFPQPCVLVVSTLEIRKNHRLLVKVWQRLLERHGADATPVLLFAGRIGWLIDDVLADLTAGGYVGGKIELMLDLSDAELRQAYQSCLFTIFPSLCEGWGLPIAESLAHGKFCIASNRTSIPEVGGDFIDYFDPYDEDDALAKIERLLFDPGYLAAREVRLRSEYRPRSWADCVHALIGKLAQPAAADALPQPMNPGQAA